MYELNIALRLITAIILGGIIGWERENSASPAGLRTHILVCVGAALITTISIEGFSGADPSRVAAQIVSGIGFLGAGTIMKEGLTVMGLTTAASLWVIAGVGMAIGSENYLAAILATGIVFLTLSLLRIMEKKALNNVTRVTRRKFIITAQNRPGLLGDVGTIFGEYDIDIGSVQIKISEGMIRLKFIVKLIHRVNLDDVIVQLYSIESVDSLEII